MRKAIADRRKGQNGQVQVKSYLYLCIEEKWNALIPCEYLLYVITKITISEGALNEVRKRSDGWKFSTIQPVKQFVATNLEVN